MSNTVTADAQNPREARAHHLRDMLESERWSARQVAIKIGASHTYVNARLKGQTDLTFSDIEAIAPLLRMTAVELFTELQEGTKMAPTPKGEGQVVPSGRIELPTYSLQADGFSVTPMLPVAANHDDNDSDAIHSVTPIRRFA